MNARSSRYAVPGPGALGAAAFIASVARSPLDGRGWSGRCSHGGM